MRLSPKEAAGLFIACAALRLPWLWWGPGAAYDMQSYAQVLATPLNELYSSSQTLGRYPYLPLWALILKAMAWLQAQCGGPLGLWTRVPALAGDLAVAFLLPVLALGRGLSKPAALSVGLAWCLAPMAWLVSGAHGQFDSLGLALVLAALGWRLHGPQASKHRWAALCLGLAVALKTWPLALLPLFTVFSAPQKRVRFVAWTALPGLVLLSPWIWSQPWSAWAPRLAYSGTAALGFSGALRAGAFAWDWRPEAYRDLDALWRFLALGALVLAQAGIAWRAQDLTRGLWAASLSLLVFAPGLSPQSLLWIVPLALLLGQERGLRLASMALALSFYALFMPELLGAAGPAPGLSRSLHWAWAALNLGWWAYAAWRLRYAWAALA